ncbi:MAG: hypothetical protein QOH31_6164, partial [Verrucomicrobiota bacterium]
MFEEINHNHRNRRRFLAITAITIAAARFGVTGFGESTVQQDNTGRSASDQGAADDARSNSITHYLEQMSHHYSGPDWGFPRGDPRLDLTDLYAFPKPGDAGKSILVMNVHPSAHDYLDRENPLGPTTAEPFAPEALYEIRIDTNGDAVADIAYRMRFSSSAGGVQTATLRRVEGVQAAGANDSDQAIVEGAPVSTGLEARVTDAGDYRFFAGRRSDPFF